MIIEPDDADGSPTVILGGLDSKTIALFIEFIDSSSIDHSPITPEVANISPMAEMFFATSFPLFVT